ncbi:MAG: hypothetical protein KY462_04045 [Actinobacteria bacterium]|nr:hypothetical protein [Actinomycetota bacterium]
MDAHVDPPVTAVIVVRQGRRPPAAASHGRWRSDVGGHAGFVTLQYVLAVGLSLVLLTMIANLAVFQYGRGVVRAALDEGVRVGSRAPATVQECQARIADVLSDGLDGTLRRGVRTSCAQQGGQVQAVADVIFPAFAPGVADWVFHVEATAVKEGSP